MQDLFNPAHNKPLRYINITINIYIRKFYYLNIYKPLCSSNKYIANTPWKVYNIYIVYIYAQLPQINTASRAHNHKLRCASYFLLDVETFIYFVRIYTCLAYTHRERIKFCYHVMYISSIYLCSG